MKMKIGWIALLGYGIVFWIFLCITDLFRTPTMYLRTTKEVEDLCRKPDLNQPQFSASQLSWSMFMVNPSPLVVMLSILLFIMLIITINRVAWSILSKAEEQVKLEFKTKEEEVHRLQNFSIKEHSYLTRKFVEVLEEKTELTKQITVLTNENRVIKEQNRYLFQQREDLTQELDIAKIEFQSLLERSQAAEAKFRQFIRAFDDHQVFEYKLRGLDLTLDTEVIKLTNSLSKLLIPWQQPLSSELDYSTEQLLEIDDKYVLTNMDMPCGENERPPSTRCTNAVAQSEMDLMKFQEELKEFEERFRVSILTSNYFDNSTLQPKAILSTTDQSQEKLEELEINAKSSTTNSEEYDRSSYETLEEISAISISGNSNDAVKTSQRQAKINLKNSTTIISDGDEYDNSSYETLECAITFSENSTDVLNNTQSQVKIDLKNSTTIISDEYDNASYETFESAITSSGNFTNTTQTQVKFKEFETNLKNSTTIISDGDEYDNSSYETLESAITISGNSTDALNASQLQTEITLTRNNSDWETQSSESSPEPICWYEKFAGRTRKYIIEPPNIQDTLSITLPKLEHLGNLRNRLASTNEFGPTTQLVQEPKRLVSSSIAFKNFMKNLNEFDAP